VWAQLAVAGHAKAKPKVIVIATVSGRIRDDEQTMLARHRHPAHKEEIEVVAVTLLHPLKMLGSPASDHSPEEDDNTSADEARDQIANPATKRDAEYSK
jgi:hypothetical protein